MAKEKGCTPSQLALAWVLAQGEDIVPIPGTKRRKYLEENVGSAGREAHPGRPAPHRRSFPEWRRLGQRYPEQMMKLVNQ